MVKNLHQGPQEDATNFMIWVGTSVSNLGKDWKGQLTQAELESLQYEVSLNGVREEIRHVLDSEIARRGRLTPHQMYEAVKKYETYVACNKRLEGWGASPPKGQSKAPNSASNYKPRFHRTTAFAATIEEPNDEAGHLQEASPSGEVDSNEAGHPREEDEGLYIPGYLEETIPDNPVLQVKMVHAMRALKREKRGGATGVINLATSQRTAMK